MSKGPGCDVPIHVIMLALYIELQLGVYSLTAVSYSHNGLRGGRRLFVVLSSVHMTITYTNITVKVKLSSC